MADMDPHLQNALYGEQKINPTEQARYLGTFLERVYAYQTEATLGDQTYLAAWEQVLGQKQGTLLINGRLGTEDVAEYMQLAKQHDVPLRLVSDPVMQKTDVIAVYTADHAVEVAERALEPVTSEPAVAEQEAEPAAEKKPWYRKFF